MKIHVFNTWILAHGLHPLTIGVMAMVSTGDATVFADFGALMFMSLIALLFSLPSLFISWGIMPKIIRHSSSLNNRFFMWLLTACVMVLLNAIVPLALFFGVGISTFITFVPAIIATFLAVCIRFIPFVKLAAEYDKPEELELNEIIN